MLPDLAQLVDIEDRIGRNLNVTEQRIASTVLHDASTSVRLYTGQQFTQPVDSDGNPVPSVVKLKVRNGKVRLSQRPVISVDAATATAFDQTEQPIFFWWDGIQTVILQPNVPNFFAWEPFRVDVNTVTMTYHHGYPTDELPPALVGIVAQIVGRALGKSLIDTGLTQETIEGYSYNLGSAAAAAGFGLLPAEKDALDKFTRSASVATVGP